MPVHLLADFCYWLQRVLGWLKPDFMNKALRGNFKWVLHVVDFHVLHFCRLLWRWSWVCWSPLVASWDFGWFLLCPGALRIPFASHLPPGSNPWLLQKLPARIAETGSSFFHCDVHDRLLSGLDSGFELSIFDLIFFSTLVLSFVFDILCIVIAVHLGSSWIITWFVFIEYLCESLRFLQKIFHLINDPAFAFLLELHKDSWCFSWHLWFNLLP